MSELKLLLLIKKVPTWLEVFRESDVQVRQKTAGRLTMRPTWGPGIQSG